MKPRDAGYLFSPTDLTNYMQSEFITWMDRYAWERPAEAEPDEDTEEQRLIQDKGLEHERGFLEALRSQGRKVCAFGPEKREHLAETLAAMRRGEEIIYQGYLEYGEFGGYPDFLVRVERPSELGAWSYEPWDTKLARHPKPYFLIQLCAYAELLERLQGLRPKSVRVVLGARGAAGPETADFKTDDFFFYYQALKRAFLEQQAAFDPDRQPEIPPLTDLGRWTGYAERELAARDDLALVANIRTSQIRKLRAAGIETVAQLAAAGNVRIPRLAAGTFEQLRRQARLQVESRGRERPAYELLQPDGSAGPLGLALLPDASAADIFFDMEGYPLVDDGREYLFGVCHYDNGELTFRDWWAHSPAEEKRAFEGFVRWAHGRWVANPGMHIYHYSHYEVDALRRLMGKYGICEQETDDLLRGEVFVDLYKIVRQAVAIGEPSYSLKYVEHLYRGRREGEVGTASESMVFYQRWLIAPDGDSPASSAILKQIRDYNEEDCRSTAELAQWLRDRQREAGIRPALPAPAEVAETEEQPQTDRARRHVLAEELLRSLPSERPEGGAGERMRVAELLAWLLEFHRREEKPIWWRRFDRQEMEENELIDDPDCLGGLRRTKRAPEALTRQSFGYEYSFNPDQETKIREGDDCLFAHDWRRSAHVESLDFDRGLVVLKISKRQGAPPERLSITPDELTLGSKLADAVERVVRKWRETGELPGALEDLLYRRRPWLPHRPEGAIVPDGVDSLKAAVDVSRDMRNTTLAVQGPPGCGKTYTGARMAAALVRGKRIGITSNSHRAINLLLAETCKAARKAGIAFDAVKVCSQEDQMAGVPAGVRQVGSGRALFESPELPQLIGGTAYAFSCEAAEGTLDYLFVDEAGQVSLASLVAMAASTRNIVLLGDQMQLAQPTQGSHPGESGLSALEYLLEGHATVPPDLGIFLAKTWRLHPNLCQFISGAVYEDRLQCHQPHTTERVLAPGARRPAWMVRDAGLIYIPVEHDGNVYESPEEEDRIAELVGELTGLPLVCNGGGRRRLTRDDILVVAPYNLQVRRLERRLKGMRVGTVDKFQGQQAPVVIFSMCSSSGDASPRGIEFLFSRNRLNVAISRAETMAIVVGHPSLARTRCSTIDQMRLVNVYCRAVAEGSTEAAARRGASATSHRIAGPRP